MKFWQFTAVVDEKDPAILKILRRPEWSWILEWYGRDVENRTIWDAEVPHELCVLALERCPRVYWTDGDFLHALYEEEPPEGDHEILTALQAFLRYGGEAIEDAVEKTCTRVRPWIPSS